MRAIASVRALAPVIAVLLCQVLWLDAAWADRASTHYHKALAYKRKGDTDAAIRELREALTLREDYAAAHHSLGMLYRKKKNMMKAIYHLEQAARLEGKSSEIHYSLGLAYYHAGRKAEAVKALSKAAEIAPAEAKIQSVLGTLLIRQDPQKAIAHLKAALKAEPTEPKHMQQLGLAYRKAGNTDKARQYLERSAALTKDPVTEFNLGVLYRHLDKAEKAIFHYEEAIRLKPTMAGAYWDVAHVYTQLKRHQEAINAYEKYVQLSKGNKAVDIARKRIEELKKK